MKILFTHTYRMSLITKREGHTIYALACEDALQEDLDAVDHVFQTTFQNRVQDLLNIVNQPDTCPDVVVLAAPHDDQCVEEAAIAEELAAKGVRVIGQPEAVCALCLDKHKTKQFLQSIGVPVTPLVDPTVDKEVTFPLVKKAKALWAGNGIQIIHTPVQLAQSLHAQANGDSFYEQFIPGIEMSVQVVRNGTRCIVSPPIYKGYTSVDLIHPLKKLRIFPNPWEEAVNSLLMETAVNIANALQTQGAMDIDFVVKDNQSFFVMEINSRLSGVSRMISAGGQNVMDMLVAMGEDSWLTYPEQELCVSAEIPFFKTLTKQEVQHLQSLPFVGYLYVRYDEQGNGTRQRILVKSESLEQLVAQTWQLKDQLNFDPKILNELYGLVKQKTLSTTS